jgi:16S rRNA (cytidine1402-2'-O)-methyltransferase
MAQMNAYADARTLNGTIKTWTLMSFLYIVSTPIGNLEDITLRALRILKQVDVIAAEDTRHTAILLHRYNIRTPTTSFHQHNEREKTPTLLARLQRGESVALVSDAGTPGISDPGFRLVKAAREAGHDVYAIPGPSAVLAALVSSGFQTDSFTFLGFPPGKTKARRGWMDQLASQPRTVVFFEAPHRLRKTLEELAKVLGERPICVAKELTKVHEKLVVQPIQELLGALEPIRGEYVIVVPAAQRPVDSVVQLPTDEQLTDYFCHIPESVGDSRRARIARTARHFSLPSRRVYAALERAKKQQTSAQT